MNKIKIPAIFTLSVLIVVLIVSCSSSKINKYGMGFASYVEEMEETLDLSLSSLSDDSIKTVFSKDGKNFENVTMKSVKYEGAAVGEIKKEIAKSKSWLEYPFSNSVADLLVSCGVHEEFDINTIKEGYYTLASIDSDGSGIRHTGESINSGRYLIIGIYDTETDTLYQIVITNSEQA